jgi:AcrR family transcriptional regulator
MTSPPADRRPPTPAAPRRDAEASRAAIETIARRAFARQPYSTVTLKAIAAEAGVSAPLVIKYFGSKEQLFARVADFSDEFDELLDAPLPELGRHLVATLLDAHEAGRMPLVRIAFALQHPEQEDLLRANFGRQVVARLRERLVGPNADLRAELAVGVLLGLGVMRGIVRGDAVLRAGERERLVDLLAPAVQGLIDDEPGGQPRTRPSAARS